MKILQLNKYITLNGGSETVMKNINDAFSKEGHDIQCLGFMKNEQPCIEGSISLGGDKKTIGGFFYDKKLITKITNFINEHSYDYVFTHNVYHDFPHAQLASAIKNHTRAKLVGFLHDFKAVCPSYLLFSSGKNCESCCGGKYYYCILKNCKSSLPSSALVMFDSYWNIAIKKAYNYYDLLISPSIFLKNKLIEMGFKKEISVLYNPVDFNVNINATSLSERKRQILYIGRLSQEKGINLFLDAATLNLDVDFVLAGSGPLFKKIKSDSMHSSNIHILGFTERNKISNLMKESAFLVIPSLWYENNPMVVLEAMASGLAVIGSEIGGIPELLSDGRGILFNPLDDTSLELAIDKALKMNDDEYHIMISKAQDFIGHILMDKYYLHLKGLINNI